MQDTPSYDLTDEYDRCYDKLMPDDLTRFWSRWEETRIVPVRGEHGVTAEYEAWRTGRVIQENLPHCPRVTLRSTISQLTKQLADIDTDLLQEQSDWKRDQEQMQSEKQEAERIKVKYEESQKEIKRLREKLDETYTKITKIRDTEEFWKDGAEKGREFHNGLREDILILKQQLQSSEEENKMMAQESKTLRTELLAEQRNFKKTKIRDEAEATEEARKKQKVAEFKAIANYVAYTGSFRQVIQGLMKDYKVAPLTQIGLTHRIAIILEGLGKSAELERIGKKFRIVTEWAVSMRQALTELQDTNVKREVFSQEIVRSEWAKVEYFTLSRCERLEKDARDRYMELPNPLLEL